MLWGAAWLTDDAWPPAQPLDRHFKGVSVAFLRGAWDDEQATFVGFKGGDNRVNHGQLDLESFVLDALGERWILDLGPAGAGPDEDPKASAKSSRLILRPTQVRNSPRAHP